MVKADVIIVGGGPAGSACAWRLLQNGATCVILDASPFPRDKICAGWIPPEVFADLEMPASDYPFSLTTFHSFKVSLNGFRFRLPTLQYAIRRWEFDDFLLKRSGAPFHQHRVQQIETCEDGYVIDGAYFGKYLVGAGGTHCPVNRALFQPEIPRQKAKLVVAMEEEFLFPTSEPACHLWFFEDHLSGYAWYVPKANGYVNVGVGGSLQGLEKNRQTLNYHWERLVQKLERLGWIREHVYHPRGHSYYLRDKNRPLRKGNAFLVGDSAGLATLDMGEGIRTAVQSGLLAAQTILKGCEYNLRSLPKYSLFSILRLVPPG